MSTPAVDPPHPAEHHGTDLGARLNVLRAGVLGAQDGIVSTAGLVVGVAGATADAGDLLVAGVAGLVAGALSMAGGEYASVSAQRDSERATLARERWELEHMPDAELEELTRLYQAKGLTRSLAQQVAQQLTAHDALGAHAETELGLDPHALVNPWHAALTSAVSFALGALLPLAAMVFAPPSQRVPATILVVLVALAVTAWVSARQGGARVDRAVARMVAIGGVAMAVTYAVGSWIGVAF